MRSNRTGTSLVYSVLLFGIVLGLAGTAGAQTAQFSAEADAVSGTVTKTVLGLLPATVTIAPVDQSKTATTGSNDVPANSASENEFGVEIYNFSNIDDSTSASDTAALDGGGGTASTGAGSLLGDLVKWNSNSDPLDCMTDPSVAGQIDCSSTQTTRGLKINGAAVAPGTYPAGTSFPVQGSIPDSQCLLGTETFTGSLVTQESQITGIGTNQATIKLIGMHLVGDATCHTLDLVPLFTTHYDLQVAGPKDDILSDIPVGRSRAQFGDRYVDFL